MCQKCHKNSCNGCDGDSNMDIAAQVSDLASQVEELMNLARFMKGHPILGISMSDDIDQFDDTTGLGSGDWEGWALCNGDNGTLDLRDRFLVGAGGSYAVGDIGGLDSVSLTAAQMPVHSHVVTDPGHSHGVTDSGHTHVINDPGHTHAGSMGGHSHTFETNVDGAHTHTVFKGNGSDGGGFDIGEHDNEGWYSAGADGTHSHTGTTDPASPAVTITSAFTGINEDPATTGVTVDSGVTGISLANAGSGNSHENRPPYMALIFVQKVA